MLQDRVFTCVHRDQPASQPSCLLDECHYFLSTFATSEAAEIVSLFVYAPVNVHATSACHTLLSELRDTQTCFLLEIVIRFEGVSLVFVPFSCFPVRMCFEYFASTGVRGKKMLPLLHV
jgi:hypothetical protein